MFVLQFEGAMVSQSSFQMFKLILSLKVSQDTCKRNTFLAFAPITLFLWSKPTVSLQVKSWSTVSQSVCQLYLSWRGVSTKTAQQHSEHFEPHLWHPGSFLITAFAKKMCKVYILQLCLLHREHVCRVHKFLKVCFPHCPVTCPGKVSSPTLPSWVIECFGGTLLRPTKNKFLWTPQKRPHSIFCFCDNKSF